jgi:glycine hydroxymethyltransferase
MIADLLDVLSQGETETDTAVEAVVRDKVKRLLAQFPIYP